MAGEKGLDRRRLYLTIDEEVACKIEKAYTKPGDRYPTDCFCRALERLAKPVKLTGEEWTRIEERIKANARARAELRATKHSRSYGPREDGKGAAKVPDSVRASVAEIMGTPAKPAAPKAKRKGKPK